MRRHLPSLLLLAAAVAGTAAAAAEPDYAEWNRLLAGYYDPAKGMDYGGLKQREAPALERLRQALAKVDPAALDRSQQLAFWLNLYNVNVVARVVAGYPVKSIRDLSTDPLIRLNVFSKETVPFGNGKVSLNWIENEKVRAGFEDPRIHFALNCAAKSCPPLRTEAYVGARVDQQLDDQVRKFFAGTGLRVENDGGKHVVHVSKIFDWFEKDFVQWGGGVVPFVRKHLPPEKAKLLPANVKAEIEHDDYDWSLNDWKR
jgi:hypothetical protein